MPARPPATRRRVRPPPRRAERALRTPRGTIIAARRHCVLNAATLCRDRVGTGVLGLFEFVVEACRPPYELREITRHLYQFGSRSAPLILTAGFAIGIVLSMHNGFFNNRGFFNLAEVSPAAFRQGALTRGGAKRGSVCG